MQKAFQAHTKPVRVLIIDDSPLFRSMLEKMLEGDPDIEVVGTASDPVEAKDLIVARQPNVITLDVEMPRMDGITFLKRLMRQRPTPVVMISSYTQENSLRTLEALDAGAVDFVAKPPPDGTADLGELRREVILKIKAAARVRLRPSISAPALEKPPTLAHSAVQGKVIAIGASTGGPKAIQDLLMALPSDICGIVIAQHMPPRFTQAFAERMNALLPLEAREAQSGDRILKGRVLVAPGGKHMEVHRDADGYYVRINDDPPIKLQKPSVNLLFRSVARSAGPNAIGILLTGMGDDGSQGLLAMKQAGAFTIAQDEASSVVFGMPKAAIALGAAQIVASLEDIPGVLLANLATEY
jgi:two-component system, chemotaxis family, protein-glutamate methylesterase/glutaminase